MPFVNSGGIIFLLIFARMFTIDNAKEALKKVIAIYGKDKAAQIERLARLETNHFKSKQYQICGQGGMGAFGEAPYYGYNAGFFTKYPEYKPLGLYDMRENKATSEMGGNKVLDKPVRFVLMPSAEAWMIYLAEYDIRHAKEGGLLRWYSGDKDKQTIYTTALNKIIPRIVNELVA